MTVIGNLSTSGINFTAGPIVGAQYGAISTLALNSALAPPAINTVLDINGTMRNRVQIISTTSVINKPYSKPQKNKKTFFKDRKIEAYGFDS
jgi:hypothetical protein